MTLTKMLHVAGLCGIALLLHGCNDCEPESDDPHDEPYDPDEPVEPVDPPPEPPAFEPPAALASGRAERQSHPFAKLATSSRALARRLQNCAAADDNKHDHDKDKDLPEPESEDACESTVRAWASDGICKGLEQLAGAWFDAGIQELKKATKPNATAFCEEMRLDWDKDALEKGAFCNAPFTTPPSNLYCMTACQYSLQKVFDYVWETSSLKRSAMELKQTWQESVYNNCLISVGLDPTEACVAVALLV
eukprot:TRINITY_DN17617_c0_g1_i1.p1 TRINITY_DN17617_c0_g1~~TRINITY_DN17617_c0_g1_i1.p1  ORF type:complete len:249 (+),score=40.89 TRINITY_DN17617_c0_g1_i1:72-818(+)